MKLGVCYYPEHWPETVWADDARRMADLGLSRVRIAEFAWSRMEPEPGRMEWAWLDRAVECLGGAGLEVIMCTPTATPPKWLVDRDPDMLAVDHKGRPRGFGSRRHYCFSSPRYREEAARVTELIAERYGRLQSVCAWQTDNEYGCHDTVVSYSLHARKAFRVWLRARYGTIEALNQAWGAVFWSQEYLSFEEVDPPVMTVTEANPSHRLDYQRFASDEVAAFNRIQTDILRRLSPGRDIVHNFMGVSTAFDHHVLSADLDVATWDSYPLGFLEQGQWSDEVKARFMRQGHPDFTAFHHDLYRGACRGRWWVMEQQPGPVNWAPWNPAPVPGMVRAWTWEAFAHGAELVSYFRWRQAPFAQEQMHAGLLMPDRGEAPAADEVRQVSAELKSFGETGSKASPVALLFDYEAKWMFDIQPQGADFDYFQLALEFYAGLRRLGLDVDIISPREDFSHYRLVVAPSLPVVDEDLERRLSAFGGSLVLGPRTASKTRDFQIPPAMPFGERVARLPLRVVRVESLRPGWVEPGDFPVSRWLEHVESDLVPLAKTRAGAGVWYENEGAHYLAVWPDPRLLRAALEMAAVRVGLEVCDFPDDLRVRRRGDLRIAINYGPEPIDLADWIPGAADFDFLQGERRLSTAGVAIWRCRGEELAKL